MSNRRSHNSILFLTTLGVYLGLVLVGGAAPPTLAHAAMTRNFEIADEIVVDDDLDKDPGDEGSTLFDSINVYFQDVEIFLENLRRLNGAGQFDLRRDTFEVAQSTQLPCVAANKEGSYSADSFVSSNESLRPSLEWFSKRLTDGYSLADCLPSERFNGAAATASRFLVKLDQNSFSVEVRVKKQTRNDAVQLLAGLRHTYKLAEPKSGRPVRKRIYDATTFRFENDQVFIVTRLPRASIDSLLADDAKQRRV